MEKVYKLIDFLRNKEVSEEELFIIYNSFLRQEYQRGFNEGCEYIRSVLRKQKLSRRENVKKRFGILHGEIEKYLSSEQCN